MMPAAEKEGYDPTRSHWFSYTQTTLGSNKICAISVVLDAGAQELFSGIRVVIIYQENNNFSEVKLRHCFDTSTWNAFQRPSQLIFATYRESKANHRKARALSQRLLDDSSRLDILGRNLPLCTITFELRDTGTGEDPSVCLSIRSDMHSDAPLRIIYDHAVPDKTFLGFLESTQTFRQAITPPIVENSMFFTGYNESDVHVVRVLPVSGPRLPFPALPFKVIRRIAGEAFGHQYMGWRTSLLSCALVCKAWYPLIDMFFDTLGSTLNNDKLDPQAVANSLEKQPRKGHLIRRIDYRNFKTMADDPERKDFSKALISVLRISTFVKEVVLCEMPSILNDNLLDALGQLEKVEIYTMYLGGFHYRIGGETQYPNIVDTQRSIANWTELRVLKLSQWEKPKQIGSSCQTPSKSKFEHLWLKDGSLTGAQLLWFASPHSHIRELSLIKILGLSNSGLLKFLQAISSTLVKLAITGSTIPRETADEPYALDIVMSTMVLLQTAHINGDLLTARAISTKPKTLSSPTRKFITINRAPQMDNVDELIEAFDTTGWDGVDIASSNIMAWNNDAQEKVFQSALESGVQFACFIDPLA